MSREERLHSTTSTASSSAPASVATATSAPPTSTAQHHPFAAASIMLHAAAQHTEQQPFLLGASPSPSSSQAAGPHVETAMEAYAALFRESAESPPDDLDIISQHPLLAPTTNAAEPAGDAGLAGAADPEVAASSHGLHMQPLLPSRQLGAGHHAAASELEDAPVADPCTIVHNQQKPPEHSREQRAGASMEEAVQNVQEPAKPRAIAICSAEELGLEYQRLHEASIAYDSSDYEPSTQDVIQALGIPFPGVTSDQPNDDVQLMNSSTQQQPRVAADQPAFDVDTESAKVASDPFGLPSIAGSDQAGGWTTQQADLHAASPAGKSRDQQASRRISTGTDVAAPPKRMSSGSSEVVGSGRPSQHHRAPVRGFPLLDWTLEETKVATAPLEHEFVMMQ